MSEKNRNMNWAEEVGGRELEGMWLEQVCDGWVALEEAQEWKKVELQHSSFSLESRDRGCGDHMLWSQWDVRTPCSHKCAWWPAEVSSQQLSGRNRSWVALEPPRSEELRGWVGHRREGTRGANSLSSSHKEAYSEILVCLTLVDKFHIMRTGPYIDFFFPSPLMLARLFTEQ